MSWLMVKRLAVKKKKENKGKPRHIETIIGGAPRENVYVKWDDEKEDCIIDDRP